MKEYGCDKIGSFDVLVCNDCATKQHRSELVECDRYDGYDEGGEPVFVETFFGCWNCKSENYEEIDYLIKS